MLSGFNTNVRHKGVLFHVQTEDSGRDHPHVITHLFHGGNILASEKQGYEHLLEEQDLESQVKRLMDSQHGAMLEQLRSGVHDPVIRNRLGTGPAADTTDPPASTPAAPAGGDRASRPAAPAGGDRLSRPAAPAGRGASPEPCEAAPDPVAGADRQRPLDEVVLDYLLESARRRTKR